MDEWMNEHLLSLVTVLGVFAYIPQMLTRVETHRYPGWMLWCTIPFSRSEGLTLLATRSAAGRKCSIIACFGILFRLKRVALPQAAPTTPQHKGIKGPTFFSNSRWLWRIIPSVFSTEAASKLYLSHCSVLLPFCPFSRDSSQEHSLITTCLIISTSEPASQRTHAHFLCFEPVLLTTHIQWTASGSETIRDS